MPVPKTERNQEILKQISENNTPFDELALKYGVTKQRISQIYYKLSGQLRGTITNIRRENRRQRRKEAKKLIKYHCESCLKPVSYAAAGKKTKYCNVCNRKSQKERRDMNITLNCQFCKKRFHPYRSKRTLGKFCSRKCFYAMNRRKK